MRFPVITNIRDVEPYITDSFSVVEKLGVIVIDYHTITGDTFKPLGATDEPEEIKKRLIQREFRGIVFDGKTGDIIRRPLHKFKNVGEDLDSLADTLNQRLQNGEEFEVGLKLDGSMIAPLFINGEVYWGTRMLSEEHHEMVKELITDHQYTLFVDDVLANGFTPIFEFTSRANRVVIDYPEPKLTLLHARNITTGEYNIDYILPYSDYYGINVNSAVKHRGADMHEFVETIRPITDIEGYVIKFSDGEMYKIKTEVYCSLHKVVSNLIQERHIAKHVIDNTIDDIIPFFQGDDYDNITAFDVSFKQEIERIKRSIVDMLVTVKEYNWTRKDFALNAQHHFNVQGWQSIIFRYMDDFKEDLFDKAAFDDDVRKWLLKHTQTNTAYENFKRNYKIQSEWKWR